METDNPLRPELRDEVALNKQASLVARDLWSHVGWHAIPLLTERVSAFWLSTDQIFRTGNLSVRGRLVRMAGVAVYLIVLALAVISWLRLRDSKPVLARSLPPRPGTDVISTEEDRSFFFNRLHQVLPPAFFPLRAHAV